MALVRHVPRAFAELWITKSSVVTEQATAAEEPQRTAEIFPRGPSGLTNRTGWNLNIPGKPMHDEKTIFNRVTRRRPCPRDENDRREQSTDREAARHNGDNEQHRSDRDCDSFRRAVIRRGERSV